MKAVSKSFEIACDIIPSVCASEHMGYWIQSEAFRVCDSMFSFGTYQSSLPPSMQSVDETSHSTTHLSTQAPIK